MTARGFTLIEMLVGLAVGSMALVAAAYIASIGVASSGRGEQTTELSGRARLLGDQLRTDIGFAGYGSNGAVGVSAGAWGAAGSYTTALLARRAIPAVRVLDNPGGTIGGLNVQPGSDVLQIVVVDPATSQLIASPVVQGATVLPVPNYAAVPDCDFVYINDHASPNGAGRTQLARFTPGAGPSIPLNDPTLFTLPQGAEVMCARWSTYWVDDTNNLHRSDLDLAAPVAIGASGMVTTVAANDVLAPGVLDLQLAAAFSSAAPGATAADHTFGALGAGFNPGAGPNNWPEVRAIRFTLVSRALRQVTNPGTLVDIPRFENRAAGVLTVPMNVPTQVVASAVELTNFRFFDETVDSSVAVAEPY